MMYLWWVLLLVLVFELLKTNSQDTSGWWSIDCGSESRRLGANLISWKIDKDFTQSGVNKRVSQQQPLDEMNTLRFFPNRQDQNCYTLPVHKQTLRYIIRAGFYYGNYDALNNPPTFDLHLDGQTWSTVNTSSSSGPIYHEAIYVTRGSAYVSVCLVQTRDREVPFVSSLEAVPLWANLYPQMGTNATFILVNITNLGGKEVRFTGLFSVEKYNRIWTRGDTLPKCVAVPTSPDLMTVTLENDPLDRCIKL